jgi:hypothetical protein
MAGQAGLTELAAGSVLLLGGTAWTVTAIEAHRGQVMLASGGEERWRSIRLVRTVSFGPTMTA